jgi:hypothetical protein
MSANEKLLSIVYGSRNDDYGGKLTLRTECSIHTIAGLANHFKLPTELVIVEWNPPADRPRLKEAISWPNPSEYLSIRLIVVPGNIHEDLAGESRVPMFEYIAKNVGIRRACGKFILSTNPDIVFSHELFKYFATQNLNPQLFYRATRVDGFGPSNSDIDWQDIIAHCKGTAYRAHYSNGTKSLKPNMPGRIGDLSKGVFGSFKKLFPHFRLFTNAAGDFLMMAANAWNDMQGYPELLTTAYIDGYGCYRAFSEGYKEFCFDESAVVYHQEHNLIARQGRPVTPRVQYRLDCGALHRGKNAAVPKTGKDWGLVKHDLEIIDVV